LPPDPRPESQENRELGEFWGKNPKPDTKAGKATYFGQNQKQRESNAAERNEGENRKFFSPMELTEWGAIKMALRPP